MNSALVLSAAGCIAAAAPASAGVSSGVIFDLATGSDEAAHGLGLQDDAASLAEMALLDATKAPTGVPAIVPPTEFPLSFATDSGGGDSSPGTSTPYGDNPLFSGRSDLGTTLGMHDFIRPASNPIPHSDQYAPPRPNGDDRENPYWLPDEPRDGLYGDYSDNGPIPTPGGGVVLLIGGATALLRRRR
ncbi:MAG: hypothetical protein VYC34_03455 [Planctomycetota bacterium]|nr:hypothetical protein [Planctomycetota bacterium]